MNYYTPLTCIPVKNKRKKAEKKSKMNFILKYSRLPMPTTHFQSCSLILYYFMEIHMQRLEKNPKTNKQKKLCATYENTLIGLLHSNLSLYGVRTAYEV